MLPAKPGDRACLTPCLFNTERHNHDARFAEGATKYELSSRYHRRSSFRGGLLSARHTARQLKDSPLDAAIEQVVSGLAGRIGFAAQEIGGDEVIAFNGDETFAMASTYKVAIAAAVLDRVDRGELSLDQLVEVPPDMFVTGVFALAETFPHPGIQLSVANLIEVMITESDNTTTDVSMELAGGAAAVTEYLRNLGITDFRVDRTTREILMDFYELAGGHARRCR